MIFYLLRMLMGRVKRAEMWDGQPNANAEKHLAPICGGRHCSVGHRGERALPFFAACCWLLEWLVGTGLMVNGRQNNKTKPGGVTYLSRYLLWGNLLLRPRGVVELLSRETAELLSRSNARSASCCSDHSKCMSLRKSRGLLYPQFPLL